MKKTGFTLIELLVVIAIIGVLASIVLVSLKAARERARDMRRIVELKQIQKALEVYISQYGTLPVPTGYGERNYSPGWWDGWWDLSSYDEDGDGVYFLDFLIDAGITNIVPVDPINTPDHNGYPPSPGYRYIYFVAPKGYVYQGGSCVVSTGGVYFLAISELESESSRPPTKFEGSGCQCLWQNMPDFFKGYFDYTLCGTYKY